MTAKVVVVDEWEGFSIVYRCETVKQAEEYIAVLEKTNPRDVHAGRYGIDAPEWLA